jgi:histidyl-tRNA synthetase
MSQKPSIPQGTRDFGPTEVLQRKYVLSCIENAFKGAGFMPIETPSMENLSTLTGKYGNEGDQLLYKVLNSGDFFKKVVENNAQIVDANLTSKQLLPLIAEKGLRYDLTVPFARYVAMNRNTIQFPFKRYQMQAVWRADRPQKGRYREFWQCDGDIIGSDSLLNEFELLYCYDEVFQSLQIPVTIKINNRKILSALAEACGSIELLHTIAIGIDKIDKIGLEKVMEELQKEGIQDYAIEKIKAYLLLPKSIESLNAIEQICNNNASFQKGKEELEELLNYLNNRIKSSIEVDFSLARGLGYYTGTIVEVQANAGSLKMSIGGGGRYDNLTSIFGLNGVSGVGISFGLDRICDVMNELNKYPENLTAKNTKILFCYFDKAGQHKGLDCTLELRARGIASEVFPDITKKISKQLDYANALNIPYVGIIGETEIETNTIMLKALGTGNQSAYTITDLIKKLGQ